MTCPLVYSYCTLLADFAHVHAELCDVMLFVLVVARYCKASGLSGALG